MSALFSAPLSERQERAIVTALIVCLPFLYFYPALLGQVILAPGDGWSQNFPVRVYAGTLLTQGQFAFWNPFIFGGMPLLASVYAGVLYPPNWLFALLPATLAQNLVVITTYHLALVGTYRYARQMGCVRLGALLAGLSFSFGGFMIVHLAQTSRIAAAAWLPWVLLALEKCRSAIANQQWLTSAQETSYVKAPAEATQQDAAPQAAPPATPTLMTPARTAADQAAWHKANALRWTALGTLFVALQLLAGEPQMLIFTALLAAACAVRGLWQMPNNSARWRFIVALGVMALLATLLCLPQLLPTTELLAQSERSNPGPAFLDPYSFPPWQLPALLFPYFFGGAMLPPYHVPYWGAEIPAVLCGYTGMLTWLLAFIALRKAPKQARFWASVTIVALVLAFGGYLPFKLNHLFYSIPVYKSFRALYKHQLEFTFALALLSGLGTSWLVRATASVRWQALKQSCLLFGTLLFGNVLLYRFAGKRLATVTPRPLGADSLHNPELLIPLACFGISALVLWQCSKRWLYQENDLTPSRPALTALLALPLVLLLDLASYGHFFHWRTANFNATTRLQDPPAVQAIKQREPALNSFRVMSQPLLAEDFTVRWPDDPNYEAINQANTSMLRGLQSVSGYDVLRPVRSGELLGSAGSAIQGFVQDARSFGLADRGLDLLNVKYLLTGSGSATPKPLADDIDTMPPDVTFARTNLNLVLEKGKHLSTDGQNAFATELALVTTLANSAHLRDGMPVLKVTLHTRAGQPIQLTLQAGRDSAEWAYDRPDVKANIQHQRATIAADLPIPEARGQYVGHHYVARFPFPRAAIERIEWTYAREDATLYLIRASLYDATNHQTTMLAPFQFLTERWRKLDTFDNITLYENLRALPRAWFVSETKTLPSDTHVLQAIKNSQLPDGSPFDPQHTALFAANDPTPVVPAVAANHAQVQLIRSEPHYLEFAAQTTQPQLLVLSEIAYAGWTAQLDEQPAPSYRTDYHLRSLLVPAGQHRISFHYRPTHWYACLGAALFGLFGCVTMLWFSRPREPRTIRN